MRISELIAKLQEAMAEHGDLPAVVLVYDGYGEEMMVEANVVEAAKDDVLGLSEPSVVFVIGARPQGATTSRAADPD